MAMAVKVLSFGMSRLTLGWLVIRVSADTIAVVFRAEDRESCFLRMQTISCHWIRYQPRKTMSIYFKAQATALRYANVTFCGRSLAGIVGSNPAGARLSLVSVMYCRVT